MCEKKREPPRSHIDRCGMCHTLIYAGELCKLYWGFFYHEKCLATAVEKKKRELCGYSEKDATK